MMNDVGLDGQPHCVPSTVYSSIEQYNSLDITGELLFRPCFLQDKWNILIIDRIELLCMIVPVEKLTWFIDLVPQLQVCKGLREGAVFDLAKYYPVLFLTETAVDRLSGNCHRFGEAHD